ncbi:MAG: 1,4-alpha-glucan branching protein GlgB [Alphaproteobacteria bacterium]|nr:1,4-alpha-glucan branching protein GlgB [Alphaproteobacteria bacterium]
MSAISEKVLYGLQNGSLKGDPFSVLGMHEALSGKGLFIRTMQPQAKSVEVLDKNKKSLGKMTLIMDGIFQLDLPKQKDFFEYEFKITLPDNSSYEVDDPYRFLPVLGDMDLYLFGEGQHWEIYQKLGAHLITHQGVQGVSFAVWAPNASRVSVVGSFNNWDGRRHLMRPRGSSGIWEIFIPGLHEWDIYKYELLDKDGRLLPLKADPYGFVSEVRPKTGSLVYDIKSYTWHDEKWMKNRAQNTNYREQPISIYEVHLGSWRRKENNRWMTYLEMAKELPEYIKEMGFTHVEFLPVAEFPFDGSWGYQETGLYAPTSRYGTPGDFRYLIDQLHQAGIGVIMDWVPAHFPKDAFGLANFDGTALYEHADPRKGEHKDWGTKIYNYGRNEVSNFLLANALFWIREYHIDGLRVDAVASMRYLDYSRKEGEWIPNQYGGRENLEAIALLRQLNELVYGENSGAVTIAEESTAWPMVSRPTYLGGLGFGFKWNMGWMHDTLDYMKEDPVNRKYHQNELTFSFLYAFTENFVLPLSHDEVVHGKGTILGRMPGDEWQRFTNLRAYYGYMFMHPGKKLLFMGQEWGSTREWNFASSLEWHLLQYPVHSGVQNLIKELNTFYKTHSQLYSLDAEGSGFEWIDGGDVENSCLTFIRKDKQGNQLIVACNFTPVPRYNYRIGVEQKGVYQEVFNTDLKRFNGSDTKNIGDLQTEEPGWNFRPYAIRVVLPPLAVVVFQIKDKK